MSWGKSEREGRKVPGRGVRPGSLIVGYAGQLTESRRAVSGVEAQLTVTVGADPFRTRPGPHPTTRNPWVVRGGKGRILLKADRATIAQGQQEDM